MAWPIEKQMDENYGSLNYNARTDNGDASSSEIEAATNDSLPDGEMTALLSPNKHVHTGGASEFSAVWNIVCTIAGVGILNLPKAMKDGGWMSAGVLVMAAIIADYTGKLLIRCLYTNRSSRLEGGYPEIGEAAFGRPGYYIVQFFHKSTLMGVCTIFLILAGGYMYNIVNSFSGSVVLNTTLWSLIVGIVVWIPLILLKTVREVALVSLVGVLASAVVVIVVVQQSLVDLPNQDNEHDIIVPQTFPTAFASMIFAYGGNVVYPHVEQSMRQPERFGRAISVSVILVTTMYVPTAIVGYYVYGVNTISPILGNLPEGSMVLVAELFITAHVILAYPMPMMAVVLELEPLIESYTGKLLGRFDHVSPSRYRWTEWAMRAVARTSIVAITVIIAISLGEKFSPFYDLVGASCNTALICVLPVVFYWKLKGIKHIHIFELAVGAFIVLVGVAGGVVGTYNAAIALTS